MELCPGRLNGYDRDLEKEENYQAVVILGNDLAVKVQAPITSQRLDINDLDEGVDGLIYATGRVFKAFKPDLWVAGLTEEGKISTEHHISTPSESDFAKAFFYDENLNKMVFVGSKEQSEGIGSCLWVLQTSL